MMQVQVWLLPIPAAEAEDPPAPCGPLSGAAQRRAARFLHAADRRACLCAHALAAAHLGRHLGVPPAALQWAAGRHGKPYVPLPGGARFSAFNLSYHRRGAALAVADAGMVGVDLEPRTPTAPAALAHAVRYLTAEERDHVGGGTGWEQRWLQAWTLKEACLKALGVGISGGPGRVGFRFAADGHLTPIGTTARAALFLWRGQWLAVCGVTPGTLTIRLHHGGGAEAGPAPRLSHCTSGVTWSSAADHPPPMDNTP